MKANQAVALACDSPVLQSTSFTELQSSSSLPASLPPQSSSPTLFPSLTPSFLSRVQSSDDLTEGAWHCTDTSPSPPRNPSCSETDMTEVIYPVKCHETEMGEEIWTVTKAFLEEMYEKTKGNELEGLVGGMSRTHASDSGTDMRMMSVILHSIEVAHKMPTLSIEKRKKTHKNTTFNLHNSQKFHKKSQFSGRFLKINGEPKAKPGRKPKSYHCAICPGVFPYKVTYIVHLQTCHQVERSQSLLYKKVRESPERLRKLLKH